jgi:NADH dehydrogenase FAD-containing subunit
MDASAAQKCILILGGGFGGVYTARHLLLRNHVIERFERADVEPDPQCKRRMLTFAIIGGGLFGVELFHGIR